MTALRPILITCEHASRRVPARFARFGLSKRMLQTHVAWDPGARPLAIDLARTLGAPVFCGRYSRLVVDLNRSAHNRQVVPAVAFGTVVPGNSGLTAERRRIRIAQYHTPWRKEVEHAIARMVERKGRCDHVSIHSFSPTLHGKERRADLGLLYDPSRCRERELVQRCRAALIAAGFRVRRNFPYRGTADGFATANRRHWPDDVYAGLELELNQRLRGATVRRRIVNALAHALSVS